MSDTKSPPWTFSLLGVGVLGPGLSHWAQATEVLRGAVPYASAPAVLPPPQRLPPNERRRASPIVKASLAVADEALAASGLEAARLPTVFTASGADGANCHALCEALASPDRSVSPTRFTNSVHNAPAGYWHIATQGMASSTSLCAFDGSFGAGLLEAVAQVLATGAPVLLVSGDSPYPEPLHAKRPLPDVMAVAMVLAPGQAEGALATLALSLEVQAAPQACRDTGLERLRTAVPTARALPLLEQLARGEHGACVLDYLDGLALRVQLGQARR